MAVCRVSGPLLGCILVPVAGTNHCRPVDRNVFILVLSTGSPHSEHQHEWPLVQLSSGYRSLTSLLPSHISREIDKSPWASWNDSGLTYEGAVFTASYCLITSRGPHCQHHLIGEHSFCMKLGETQGLSPSYGWGGACLSAVHLEECGDGL